MRTIEVLNKLSACHLASAANGNHAEDKEITHLACFLMEQRKFGHMYLANSGTPSPTPLL